MANNGTKRNGTLRTGTRSVFIWKIFPYRDALQSLESVLELDSEQQLQLESTPVWCAPVAARCTRFTANGSQIVPVTAPCPGPGSAWLGLARLGLAWPGQVWIFTPVMKFPIKFYWISNWSCQLWQEAVRQLKTVSPIDLRLSLAMANICAPLLQAGVESGRCNTQLPNYPANSPYLPYPPSMYIHHTVNWLGRRRVISYGSSMRGQRRGRCNPFCSIVCGSNERWERLIDWK